MANDLIALAEAEKPTLAKLLEGHPSLTADKLIQLLMSATKASYYLRMVADPKTGHPETLIAALLQAAAVGLEPNTPLQHCALIPRKAKDGKWTANFQLMFRGRMHLGMVHGGLADWRAVLVYKQDVFAERPASPTEPIMHEPARGVTKKNEDIVGAYSLVFLPNGMVKAKYMDREEIESIRDRYSDSWKAYKHDKSKDDSPWVQRPGEMLLKTVVNNHYKQIMLTSPAAVQIDGQLWERGPDAAARVPGEDENIEDVVLAAEDQNLPGTTGQQVRQTKADAGKLEVEDIDLTTGEVVPSPAYDEDGPIGSVVADEIMERLKIKATVFIKIAREMGFPDWTKLPRSRQAEFEKRLQEA